MIHFILAELIGCQGDKDDKILENMFKSLLLDNHKVNGADTLQTYVFIPRYTKYIGGI